MPLFHDDEHRFISLVLSEEAYERDSVLTHLYDKIASEVIRYGIYNDIETLNRVASLYQNEFIDLPVIEKRSVYEFVTRAVRHIGGSAAGALTPFMMLERSTVIVSTATIDYVSMGSLVDDDPMSRPRDALELVKNGIPENPAAVVGGLLALGDPRVCELLRPLRSDLNDDDIAIIGKCHSGFVARCTVTFYIEWLEALVAGRDVESETQFGIVASGLYNLIHGNKFPFIANGLRPFPAPVDGNWPELQREDIGQFARSVSPRLLRIERQEGVPRIMPVVIRAFGLKPFSSIDETAKVPLVQLPSEPVYQAAFLGKATQMDEHDVAGVVETVSILEIAANSWPDRISYWPQFFKEHSVDVEYVRQAAQNSLDSDWFEAGVRAGVAIPLLLEIKSFGVPLRFVTRSIVVHSKTAELVHKWYSKRISPSATEIFIAAGIDAHHALNWLKAGFTPREASEAVTQGLSVDACTSARHALAWSDVFRQRKDGRFGLVGRHQERIEEVIRALDAEVSRSSSMFSHAYQRIEILDGGYECVDEYGFGAHSFCAIYGELAMRFICSRSGVRQRRDKSILANRSNVDRLEENFINHVVTAELY